MSADPEQLATVVAAIKKALPGEMSWPGGWPGQVEAALMDAVLSIRANYGQPHNGVRGAVRRWRAERGDVPLDDLNVLATQDPERLASVIDNRQKLSGGSLKCAAIVQAAQNLLDVGVRHAADLAEPTLDHKRAYTNVNGLGSVTWEYLLMLLGVPGVKADTWIVRFVNETLGRPVSSAEARTVLLAAAKEVGVSTSALDHSIWNHMRSRRQG